MRPLTLGAIGGLVGPLLGVGDGFVRVVLCLIDALLELIEVIRGRRPGRRYNLVDLRLQAFKLCGKVHRCSPSVDFGVGNSLSLGTSHRARGTPWSGPRDGMQAQYEHSPPTS
jgi:hypothetical protein